MSTPPKYAELQRLADEALVERYDAAAPGTNVGIDFYLDELHRRGMARDSAEMLRQNAEMLELTRQVRGMTRTITGLTVVNVVLVGITIWIATQG